VNSHCSDRNTVDCTCATGSGQVFASLDDARRASTQPGDVVLIRDLSTLAPTDVWSNEFVRGKWRLRPYRLADGQSGNQLMVCDFAGDDGPAAVPPAFEVKLELAGWYTIWIGVPLMQRSADGGGGVNVALEGDPGHAIISTEAHRFRGRWAHPFNCEYMCYWKFAQLDKQTLRIRVPWGTYSSGVWGLVRGGFSALRLVRLSDEQVEAYLADIADPSTKRVIAISDGFSGYWDFAEPGKGIDADWAMTYRDTDVGKFILQTPNTGVTSWRSQSTSMIGDLVGEDEWKLLRKGDRRIVDYFRWAVRNGQENFRVAADVLRGSSTELHASLRMNLFFGGDPASGPIEKLLNGKFWFDHPELRKPGSLQLDYSIPAVRAYIISILMEMASTYDVSGINMDFTRWPPIADPLRHGCDVLTSFVKEVRQYLDKVQADKGRRLALSAHVAEEFYTGGDLASQKIDLDAWLGTGVLDFISVESRQHVKHIATARRHGVPYYASQDWGVKGMFADEDPDMPFPGDAVGMHDPYPGDEFVEQHEFDKQFGQGVDPTDYDRCFSVRYTQGVDGVCLTNGPLWRSVGRMGHVEEMKQRAVTGAIWGQEPGQRIGAGLSAQSASTVHSGVGSSHCHWQVWSTHCHAPRQRMWGRPSQSFGT